MQRKLNFHQISEPQLLKFYSITQPALVDA